MNTILEMQSQKRAGKIPAIKLPDGRWLSIGQYVAGWRKAKRAATGTLVSGFAHFPEPVEEILEAISFGVNDRINLKTPGYGKGRKWDGGWYMEMWRASRDLNQPRLIIHRLPADLHKRFGHRIFRHD